MNRIIVIDSKWDIDSPGIQNALKASKSSDTEVAAVYLTDDSGKEATDRAEDALQKAKQKFSAEGIGFSSSVVSQEPDAFMKLINDLMPASLVILGDVSFSDAMVKGGVSKEALKEKLACPVASAEELSAAKAESKPSKGTNWAMWLVYAAGSVLMYGVFFPRIRDLNEKIFMTESILGGVAIMAVVVVHAWIWGNTTHILPKIFKLEK